MHVKKVEKQKKEIDVIIEDYYCCDKCNKKIVEELYNAFNFDFEYNIGATYPEGGSGDKYTLNLCKECAEEFIIFLKANNYRINESEWDY